MIEQEIEFIDIDKDAIPYIFEMKLNNKTYQFKIQYNTAADFFTIDLYLDNKLLVAGEKIIYGKPLFNTATHKDIPEQLIIPYDINERETRVTFENLSETVYLCLL